MIEPSPEIGIVMERLHKLERQNRRFRFGLAAVGLAVFAAFLFATRTAVTQPASESFETLKAHAFALTDQNGNVRSGLFLRPNSEPDFFLADAAGTGRLDLTLGGDDQPALTLYDAAGKRRAALTLRQNGTSFLVFGDAAGTVRAGLGVGPDDVTSLAFFDTAGRNRVALIVLPDGRPNLGFLDSGGTTRLLIGHQFPTSRGQGGNQSWIAAYDEAGHLMDRWPSP